MLIHPPDGPPEINAYTDPDFRKRCQDLVTELEHLELIDPRHEHTPLRDGTCVLGCTTRLIEEGEDAAKQSRLEGIAAVAHRHGFHTENKPEWDQQMDDGRWPVDITFHSMGPLEQLGRSLADDDGGVPPTDR